LFIFAGYYLAANIHFFIEPPSFFTAKKIPLFTFSFKGYKDTANDNQFV